MDHYRLHYTSTASTTISGSGTPIPPQDRPHHHDGVDDVVFVVSQCTDSLPPGNVRLGHDQLDVPQLQAGLIHLQRGTQCLCWMD